MTDWHDWRGQGIGGSDVAAVLGISPYATPFSVYADKAEGVRVDVDNDYTEFGKRAERMLAEWFHDRTGLHVVGEQTWCTHREHPWRRATVDGFVAESVNYGDIGDVLGVWEAKTTGAGTWDELPPHIAAQVQWQLHVTGLAQAWVTVLHGRRLEIYEVEADHADQAFIVAELERFWHDHVLSKVPPPVDASVVTARALGALYPQHEPAMAVEIPEALWTDLVHTRAEVKFWQTARDHDENEIKALLGDAEIAIVNGAKVATWRTQTSRRVDLGRLEADHPDLADKYRTTTTTRVLRVAAKENDQ